MTEPAEQRNAIVPPPPDNLEESGQRVRSDPTDLKTTQVRAAAIVTAIGLLVGAVTDWAGIGAVVYLAPLQHWPVELTAGAVVGLASGTIVGKLRGKLGGSTSSVIATTPALKIAAALITASYRM